MSRKAGRAISTANVEAMRAMADRFAEHHDELGAMLKSLGDRHKAMEATRGKLEDFVDFYAAAREG